VSRAPRPAAGGRCDRLLRMCACLEGSNLAGSAGSAARSGPDPGRRRAAHLRWAHRLDGWPISIYR